MNHTISIAMCTYNGAKFIKEQITSILQQTVKPVEIVICDDGSTDNTVQIINEIRQHADVLIQVHINKPKLGVTGNFAKSISLCKGDLIALSDQDDFWMPQKLEKLAVFLDENAQYDVVFSNLDVVNQQLVPLNFTMWDYIGFTPQLQTQWKEGDAFRVLDQHGSKVTGCSMMFKKSYVEPILPYLFNCTINKLHDEIITLIAARSMKIGFVKESLVLYRQHDRQVVGTRHQKVNTSRNKLDIAKDFISIHPLIVQRKELQEKLDEMYYLNFEGADIDALKETITFLDERIKYSRNPIKRIRTIFRNYKTGKYGKYTHDVVKSVLKDLVIIK